MNNMIKKNISINNSGVDIKSSDRVPVNIIPKSFLKCCLPNVEYGTQDDILWDNSEQSGRVHHLQKMKV
jgi:hypothetical protein